MSGGYQKAIRGRAAHVCVCFDPFHVVALANRALDRLRRALWNRLGKSKGSGKVIKGRRWALLKDPSALTESQQGTLAFLAKLNSPLYRGYLLKELRAIYAPPSRPHAAALLDAWLKAAARSKLTPFVKLARTLRTHREGILNAIRLGLSNKPPRGARRPHPPHLPPKLRLPQRRTADRAHPPLLRTDQRPATHMNGRRPKNVVRRRNR